MIRNMKNSFLNHRERTKEMEEGFIAAKWIRDYMVEEK
jgi:hypothetical protein